MLTLLNDYGGRVWNIAPVQAASDWTNGAALFIRNKLVTGEYWYSNDTHIEVSTTARTKFIVRGTAFKSDDPQVLIRSDSVTIELAADSSSSDPVYVVNSSSDSLLTLSSQPYTWKFGDFFASFGQEWGTDSTDASKQLVNHSPGTSVVWELV
jgi:hypothetical protein